MQCAGKIFLPVPRVKNSLGRLPGNATGEVQRVQVKLGATLASEDYYAKELTF